MRRFFEIIMIKRKTNKKITMVLLVISLCLPIFAFAEAIVLKSGQTIEGKVTEKTDKYITVDIAGTSQPYFLDDIESIAGEPPLLFNNISRVESPSANKKEPSRSANLQQGDHGQAISSYPSAIESNPNLDPGYYSSRGNAYDKKGDHDRAIAEYSKAIELNPDSALAYNNRGVGYRAKTDYEQAFSDFNKAIELTPNYPEAYANRGITYTAKGDHDRAITEYSKAIELNPNNAIIYEARALAYYFKQDYDKAWIDVHKAEKLGEMIDPQFIEDLKKVSGNISTSPISTPTTITKDRVLHVVFTSVFLIYLFYPGICFALIARKLRKNLLLGLGMVVPILSIFLLPILAEEENYLLFIFLLLIPVVNFFAIAYLIGNIAANLNKDKWLFGIGSVIPLLGLVFLSILAFSRIDY